MEKRGRGDFFGGIEAGNYVANFSYRILSALDDGAAFFTPIPCDSAVHRFELFELVAFVARSVKTFRAVAVAQFVRRHSQMAVPAAQSFLSFGQKFESGVIARTHGDL